MSLARESVEPRNVILVSHCDFTGNTALHVYNIALELHRRGVSPVVVVPGDPRTVRDLGRPPFAVRSFRDARRGRLQFPNGADADLIHAFTPREHVRKLTLELAAARGCPYVVHLEDREDAIVDGHSYPLRAAAFIAGAAGLMVVTDRLLELNPDHMPSAVVWPGFDEAILQPSETRDQTRNRLRVAHDEIVVVYPGNTHRSNLEDVRALYLAVAQLRASGQPVVLVKTGWDFVHKRELPALGEGLRELGWVRRSVVLDLLAAADVLVQPGRSGLYNDYRFPSKLPEFLASGRPVVLPRTNIGLHLRDGVEALLLDRGDADEISTKVALLARDAALRAEIGRRGRAFAVRELRWKRAVNTVEKLYRTIAA